MVDSLYFISRLLYFYMFEAGSKMKLVLPAHALLLVGGPAAMFLATQVKTVAI